MKTKITITLQTILLIALCKITIGQSPFNQHIILEEFEGACSISAADFDNDGHNDFVVSASGAGHIAWFKNDGDQNFTSNMITEDFAGARTLYASDINSDSYTDFVATAFGAHKISWFQNDGSGNFTENIVTDNLIGASFVHTADIDGDSDIDIIAAACDSHKILWFENDGNENFTEHNLKDNWDKANCVFPVDLDEDGDMDILGTAKAGQIIWFDNNGSQNFTETIIYDEWDAPNSVQAADLDNDGDIDIAATSCGNSDAVGWFENDGTNQFIPHILKEKYNGARQVCLSDINNDNNIDILAIAWVSGTTSIFSNNGSKNFKEQVFSNDAYDMLKLSVIDLDNDNDLDILGACFGEDEIRWWESSNEFLVPDFVVEEYSGHSPVSIQFEDLSFAQPTSNSYKWDFDNDGIIDSEEKSPTYTYSQEGKYTVSLTVSNGSLSETIVKENFIRVFNGESAIEFTANNGKIYLNNENDLNLTDQFTFECWINPFGYGVNGQTRVFEKEKIRLSLYESGTLIPNDSCFLINLLNEDGTISKFYTESKSAVLNEWQHIALTYDANTSDAHIYINGIEAILEFAVPPNGSIINNSEFEITIGNKSDGTRGFAGLIDEFRVWNISRTESEIQENMEKNITGNTEHLICYLKMNEGTGNLLLNTVSDNYNGNIEKTLWSNGINFTSTSIDLSPNNKIEPNNNIKIYPNPFQDDLSIEISFKENTIPEIEVYNIVGQKIHSLNSLNTIDKKNYKLMWNGLLNNRTKMKPGIYFIHIKANNEIQSFPVIKL
jgi:PKD repeat protein